MSIISRYWGRFIDELARIAEPLLVRRRATRRHVLVDRGGTYEAYLVDRKGATLLASGTLEAVSDRLKRQPVDFRLATGGVMSKVLTLPATSREYLDTILRNQLERLTPWAADRVAFGYAVAKGGGAAPAGQINVRLVATARENLGAAIARLAGAGIKPVSIGIASDPIERETEVELLGAGRNERGEVIRRRISLAVMVLVGLSLAAAGYSSWRLYESRKQLATLEAAMADRRAVLERVVARTAAIEDGQELAALKRDAIPMAVLLDELSAVIPDDTYLTELVVENGEVRLQGLAPDATSLIALLEGTDMLEGVDFAAATTRDPNTARDEFRIVGRLVTPAPLPAATP